MALLNYPTLCISFHVSSPNSYVSIVNSLYFTSLFSPFFPQKYNNSCGVTVELGKRLSLAA